MSLLGVDAGGSGCKAIIFTNNAEKIIDSSVNYSSKIKDEKEAEWDFEQVWNSIKCLISNVSEKAKNLGDPVKALCFSVPGEAFVLVNKNLEIIQNTFTGFDIRGSEFIEKISSDLDAFEIYKKTGQPLDFIYPPLRTLWLKNNKKDIFMNIYKFLGWQEYFLMKLGVNPITEPSLASRYMLFDINKKKWIKEYLNYFDIKEEILPNIGKAGDIAGEIPIEICKELNLDKNAIAVVGGFDQSMTALGAGLLSERIGTIGSGTVEAMSFVKDKVIINDKLYKHYYPISNHAYGDLFLTFAFTFSGGSVIRWFYEKFVNKSLSESSINNKIYSKMYDNMPVEPSNLISIPTFTGNQTFIRNSKLRALLMGMSLNTSKYDILKSLLEGMCFVLKQNFDYLKKVAKLNVEDFNIMGGGSNSTQWVQMKSDILDIKINTLNETNTGCIAAIIFSGIGLGIYKNFHSIRKNFITIKKEYFPRKKYTKFYNHKYQLYEDILSSLEKYQEELFKMNHNFND